MSTVYLFQQKTDSFEPVQDRTNDAIVHL